MLLHRKPGFRAGIMYIHGGSEPAHCPAPLPAKRLTSPGSPGGSEESRGARLFHAPVLTGP